MTSLPPEPLTRDPSGDELLRVLQALSNPHRLRVLGILAEGRTYVSQMARQLGISRPLLQIHLRKLEEAGLVSAVLEHSEDGKSLKFYGVEPFSFTLTPSSIGAAASSVTIQKTDHE